LIFEIGFPANYQSTRSVIGGKALYTSACTRTRPLSRAAEDLEYIRNLPYTDAGAVIFGKINKHNYKTKEGEAFSLPVSFADLIIEGKSLCPFGKKVSDEKKDFSPLGIVTGAR